MADYSQPESDRERADRLSRELARRDAQDRAERIDFVIEDTKRFDTEPWLCQVCFTKIDPDKAEGHHRWHERMRTG